jgi:hypothetical protein
MSSALVRTPDNSIAATLRASSLGMRRETGVTMILILLKIAYQVVPGSMRASSRCQTLSGHPWPEAKN